VAAHRNDPSGNGSQRSYCRSVPNANASGVLAINAEKATLKASVIPTSATKPM
jgi:hypothetical protein